MKLLNYHYHGAVLSNERATRDVAVLRVIGKQFDAILTLLDALLAQQTADTQKHKSLYMLLAHFGDQCANLCTRRGQVRDRHSEIHWQLITFFGIYFSNLIRDDQYLQPQHLLALRADLVVMKTQVMGNVAGTVGMIAESEAIANTAEQTAEEYQVAMQQHQINITLHRMLVNAWKIMKQLDHDISDAEFSQKHLLEHLVLQDALDTVMIEMRILLRRPGNRLLTFVMNDVETALTAMRTYPGATSLRAVVKALKAASEQTRANLKLDIDEPTAPATTPASAHPVPSSLVVIIIPSTIAYYKKLLAEESEALKELPAKPAQLTLKHRAAILRLVLLAGEVCKQLKVYDVASQPDDELKAWQELRNHIAHLFDSAQGREQVYALLTSDADEIVRIFVGAAALLPALVTMLALPQRNNSNAARVEGLKDAIEGLKPQHSPYSNHFAQKISSICLFNQLATTLDAANTTMLTRQAGEFFLIAAGQMLKDFELDRVAQIEIAKMAALHDFVFNMIETRNGLAHELSQLGLHYHATVMPLLQQLIVNSANLQRVDVNMTAAYAMLTQAGTPYDLLLASDQKATKFGTWHYNMGSSKAARRKPSQNAIVKGLDSWIDELTLTLQYAVRNAVVKTDISVLREAVIKLVHWLFEDPSRSSSELGFTSPMRRKVDAMRKSPARLCALGFQEEVEQIQQSSAQSAAALQMATTNMTLLTPGKQRRLQSDASRVADATAVAVQTVTGAVERRTAATTPKKTARANDSVKENLNPTLTTPEAKQVVQTLTFSTPPVSPLAPSSQSHLNRTPSPVAQQNCDPHSSSPVTIKVALRLNFSPSKSTK